MTEEIQLSPKQEEIVYAKDGPIYVRASAGSGKTRVLTERVRHLLGRTKREILVLTFTNKAGEEIESRLKGVSRMKEHVFVGTFHGFCQYILINHGYLIGFEKMPHILDAQEDKFELIRQTIQQNPSCSKVYKNLLSEGERQEYLVGILNSISEVKRKLIDDKDAKEYMDDEDMVLLYQNYQDILRSQNIMDFDDLLLRAYSLFVNFPHIASSYRQNFFAVCVDEAQHLNNAQYHLLRALANNECNNTINECNNTMMVGDPNQSIFHFSGSSPDYMDKHFVKDFEPGIFDLDENYRSSKCVLTAAKKIISNGTENVSGMVKEGRFEIRKFTDENYEAEWIINKIKELVKLENDDDIEGKITFDKMAVLARNKYVFKQLEEKALKANIPFYYKMTHGVIQFETDLMKIFELGLRVRLNPQDRLHKERLLDRLHVQTTSDKSLKDIIPSISDAMKKELMDVVMKILEDGSNMEDLLEKFRSNLNNSDNKSNGDEKIMIFNDIDELLKHWHNYSGKKDNKSLHQFRSSMVFEQTHPLSKHPGITLNTVHGMKGQEFDIVFIMGADDGTFPDYRAIQNNGIEMKQEKNNMYVAFTRAKRFLYVTWPEKRTMPWESIQHRKVSRFLVELYKAPKTRAGQVQC